MKRVYHPVSMWEELRFNMWGTVDDRASALEKARTFTGDAGRYGEYMRRVTREWPISCENALTDLSINRKAWIGHAACAMAIQIPEDIIREAWGQLTDEQRRLANAQADDAIKVWEYCYREGKQVSANMGEQMLF